MENLDQKEKHNSNHSNQHKYRDDNIDNKKCMYAYHTPQFQSPYYTQEKTELPFLSSNLISTASRLEVK